MSKNKIISGIEIGSSKVVCIIGQVGKSGLGDSEDINIVGVCSVLSNGIKKGQIVNIEEAVGAIETAVDGAERMAGLNLESAYIALGGASITSINSHGVVAVSSNEGEIGIEDVERAIESASAISLPTSKEVLHVLPKEFIVDGERGVRDPIGMSGIRLEVETHIIAASTASIKNIRKAVDSIGINIDGIVFSGLAASNASLTETEKELGCVLVDIGGGTTSIAAYIEGSLVYSGVIPIGARNVTSDLAIGLRVTLETAEKIKIKLSESEKKVKKENEDQDSLDLSTEGISELKKVSKKTLIEGIIKPRLNEIFTMVRLELEKAGLIHQIPSGAVITGGGAMTVGIVESSKRMLSLPTRIGIPGKITGLIDDVMTSEFCVPVGLIFFGAKESQEVNKKPSSFVTKFPKFGLRTPGFLAKIVEAVKNLLP